MNVAGLVENEITVVIDDYDTGEVVYEGSLYELEHFGAHHNVSGFEMSCEWVLKNGNPIALVTVRFVERLGAFKQYLEWLENIPDDEDCVGFHEWERRNK